MSAQKQLSTSQNFIFGGLSGCLATVVIQPTDFLKTRMQLLGEGKEHPSPILLGVFNTLIDYFTTSKTITDESGKTKVTTVQPNFAIKIGCGMVGGAIGAVVGNPADLSLVRMTSGRYGYKNVFDALIQVSKNEGVLTLWRGCSPTVVRAIVLNAAQLGVYAQAKQSLLSMGIIKKDGVGLHVSASLIAGYVCTVVSLPIDLTKTRLQSMQQGQSQVYSGAFDVLTKTIKAEGVMSLWKGFWPYFARLGPQTILTWTFLEQFREYFGHTILKVIACVLVMFMCNEYSIGATPTSEGVLQVHVISRHCDRLPITPLKIPNDPVDWVKLSNLQLGDLTGLGQEQCKTMGDIIRKRYLEEGSSFKIMGIDSTYNSEQFYFRSTEIYRTLMSMFSISMGLFPQDHGRMQFALPNGTQAIPIRTVQEDMDALLIGFSFCNTVIRRMQAVHTSKQASTFFSTNRELIDKMYNVTGWNTGDDTIGTLFDLMTVQRAHNMLKLNWINENWDKVDQLRNDFLLMLYNYAVIGKEGSSILISTILNQMTELKKKYVHYSAHDTTLQSVTASLKLNDKDYPYLGYQPKYGAHLAFELHQMNDGTRAVRLVHGSQFNDANFTSLTLKSLGCTSEFCPFDTFKRLATEQSTVFDWCSACDNYGRDVCAAQFLKSNESSTIAFLISTPVLALTNAITLIVAIVCCARAQYNKSKYTQIN
ncbi:hypothetical protein C9374_007659 [Naegleria lovaniensis]|uniref:Uncharacterized protein n=1 Tax=Naegleria lovaniensis TaxID=51637 RepID=A0AA88GKX3_NAELO|nr:uncharacterized protein C9374_007659 [Naegleria lovaniensis]KAG2379021.1 hypothetical protein C9374_007659 [Naegleria lovaniensis]